MAPRKLIAREVVLANSKRKKRGGRIEVPSGINLHSHHLPLDKHKKGNTHILEVVGVAKATIANCL